jgi:hypothetical protein
VGAPDGSTLLFFAFKVWLGTLPQRNASDIRSPKSHSKKPTPPKLLRGTCGPRRLAISNNLQLSTMETP